MSIKYKGTNVAGTTNVIANPTLAGTEANLTSLEVGGTKYKVEGGGISEITGNTDTDLTGLLKGNGSKVSAETRYVPTVEVTQAQYNALVSGGTVDPTVMYVITDDNAYPATQSDLASIQATGSTNGTGATIPNGTYFYLNNVLVQAKADIASGASFVLNTNYSVVTAGALNDLKSAFSSSIKIATALASVSLNNITDSGFYTWQKTSSSHVTEAPATDNAGMLVIHTSGDSCYQLCMAQNSHVYYRYRSSSTGLWVAWATVL